jgi:hypothetical protein
MSILNLHDNDIHLDLLEMTKANIPSYFVKFYYKIQSEIVFRMRQKKKYTAVFYDYEVLSKKDQYLFSSNCVVERVYKSNFNGRHNFV